jgi:hypothetical protein
LSGRLVTSEVMVNILKNQTHSEDLEETRKLIIAEKIAELDIKPEYLYDLSIEELQKLKPEPPPYLTYVGGEFLDLSQSVPSPRTYEPVPYQRQRSPPKYRESDISPRTQQAIFLAEAGIEQDPQLLSLIAEQKNYTSPPPRHQDFSYSQPHPATIRSPRVVEAPSRIRKESPAVRSKMRVPPRIVKRSVKPTKSSSSEEEDVVSPPPSRTARGKTRVPPRIVKRSVKPTRRKSSSDEEEIISPPPRTARKSSSSEEPVVRSTPRTVRSRIITKPNIRPKSQQEESDSD